MICLSHQISPFTPSNFHDCTTVMLIYNSHMPSKPKYIELRFQVKVRKTFPTGWGLQAGQVLHKSDANSPSSMEDKSISLLLFFFLPHLFSSTHTPTSTGATQYRSRYWASGCGLNESLISLGLLALVTQASSHHQRPFRQTLIDEVACACATRTHFKNLLI